MRHSTKGIFTRPYPVFLLILLAITFSVWIYLWIGLANYEAGIPKNLMSQLVEDISFCAEEGSCEDIIAEHNASGTVGSYEDKGIALANLVKGKSLRYSKSVGVKSDSSLYYSIFSDEVEVAKVKLSQKEKKGILGLALYEITELSGTEEVTILAPANAIVAVKGSELNSLDVKNTGVVPRDLKKLHEYPERDFEIPVFDEYFIEGLFLIPKPEEIEITLSDGTKAESVFLQKDYILGGKPASEGLVEEITERITTITKKYSYYMSDDLGWTGFKGYIVNHSPIYDRLRTLEVYWYTLHDSTRFENMVVGNLFVFSDNLISLRLTYDYIVIGQGKVTTYPTDLTYYLAKDTDGKWRVAEMIVN
ncbi:MAG: hypothetical protein EOM59_00570 [Clostridia bacterium]|nr:hypothetical protein [Clostridia bacterium]